MPIPLETQIQKAFENIVRKEEIADNSLSKIALIQADKHQNRFLLFAHFLCVHGIFILIIQSNVRQNGII